MVDASALVLLLPRIVYVCLIVYVDMLSSVLGYLMSASSPSQRAGAAALKALSPYFTLLVRGLSRVGHTETATL